MAKIEFLSEGRIATFAERALAQRVALEIASEPPFAGFVDFDGYHTLAGGWCFAGWVSRQDGLPDDNSRAEACFDLERIEFDVFWVTFVRDDIITGDAIGFLVFLPASIGVTGTLSTFCFDFSRGTLRLKLAHDAYPMSDSELIGRLDFLILAVEPGPRRGAMEVCLYGHQEKTGMGFVEYYGYHGTAGGWFFVGRVIRVWLETESPEWLLISLDGGEIRAATISCLCDRTALPADAASVLFFVPAKHDIAGLVSTITLRYCNDKVLMQALFNLPYLREAERSTRVKDKTDRAKPGLYRARITNILSGRPYSGENTLDARGPAIFLYVDQAFICGATGLVIMGWLLAKTEEMRDIWLCCGAAINILEPQSFVRVARHDVLEDFAKFGFEDVNCGFIACVADALQLNAELYLEVETNRFEIGYRNIPSLTGRHQCHQAIS